MHASSPKSFSTRVLGLYLDDPVRLFLPARLLQSLMLVIVTMITTVGFELREPAHLGAAFGGVLLAVVVCGHLVPMIVSRRDPERVLEVLLPSFHLLARSLAPVTRPLVRLLQGAGRERPEEAAE